MVAPVPAERDLAALVTVGIKHTSAFPRRRAMLGVLLASIRARYGDSLRILVADDGRSAHKPTLQRHGARRIVLPRDSGLSHGRNELVRAARTPYITLLDDDVVFHAATDLEALVDALERSSAGVAGGCYADVRDVHGAPDCYNLRFDATDGGAVVHERTLPAPVRGGGACVPAHATHNVFVGRTAALRRFGWDPRQKVMEHETFFYQLYLAGVGVLACPRRRRRRRRRRRCRRRRRRRRRSHSRLHAARAAAVVGRWRGARRLANLGMEEHLKPQLLHRLHGNLVARDHALDADGAAHARLDRHVDDRLAVARANVDEARVGAEVPRRRPGSGRAEPVEARRAQSAE